MYSADLSQMFFVFAFRTRMIRSEFAIFNPTPRSHVIIIEFAVL